MLYNPAVKVWVFLQKGENWKYGKRIFVTYHKFEVKFLFGFDIVFFAIYIYNLFINY